MHLPTAAEPSGGRDRPLALRYGLFAGTLAILALTLLVYRPILPGFFLMDDLALVQTDNPLVNGQLTAGSVWFQTDFPLSNMTMWLEWLAWGKNPALYHVVDLALHALGAILVWRLLKRLNLRGAWLAGALFALHPVCVNSVARVAEIKNTLSLPFFLLSVLFYLRYEATVLYPVGEPRPAARRLGTLFYALSLIAFVLALLSKTSTVMLPVALLACAAWQRGRLSRRDVVHTGPYFVLALGFGLMSIWFQKHQALAGVTLAQATLWERLILASRAFWFYLGKAFLPVNLNLVYPPWKSDVHSPLAFLPLGVMAVSLVLLWRFRRSGGRDVLFALGCFFILLFPALGLFDAKFLTSWQVSDHLQYLPLIAPVALVAAFLSRIPRPAVRRGCAAVSIALLFLLTSQWAGIFASEENLMRDTLAKNPASTLAHNYLGIILGKQNDQTNALTQFEAAVRCDPNNAAAQANLGGTLFSLGQVAEAQSHLRDAVRLKPFDPNLHVQLANVLTAGGRAREACLQLRSALQLKPTPELRLQLAALLYETGEFHEAVGQLRQVVMVQPDLPEAFNNLAWLLATCADEQTRNGTEAVQTAERACQMTQFKDANCLSTLGAAYAETGRFPEAIAAAEMALRQQTAAGDVHRAEVNRQLLRLYHSRKPYHATPAPRPAAAAEMRPRFTAHLDPGQGENSPK